MQVRYKTSTLSGLAAGVAFSAVAAGMGQAAWAQAADEPVEVQGEAAGQPDGSRRLNTVVVQSTKRETTLQDAPISIGVVDGETIADYNIADLTDLQGFVPALTVQKTFGNWTVRVRGLGSGQTNTAFDSSVSIFNDGIYCGRSRCLEAGFFDTENVEVARGPQGALFGKSTIAGAITVTSARPTDVFSGYVRAGTELEHGGYRFDGAVSGPLSETLRGRLALQYKDLDGDVKNLATGQDDNSVEAVAARGSFEWDITADTQLWGKVETASNDVYGRRNQLASAGALLSPTSPVDPDNIETNPDDVRIVSTGIGREDFDVSDQTAITLALDTSIGDHTLTLIGGHWQLDYENFLDVDGVPETILNTTLTEDYEQNSLEARLLSPTGQTLEYIVGAMYHTSTTETSQVSQFFPGFYQSVGVPPFLTDAIPGATGALRSFERDTDTVSIYGQLTWNVSDRLSIIGDLRYTEEEQDGRAQGQNVTYPDISGPPVLTPDAPFQSNPEYLFFQVREDESLDPSIRAIYELTDEINVYAAYSTGSKPGGLKANDGGLGGVLLSRDAAFLEEFVGQSVVTPEDLRSGLTLKQGNGVFDFEDEDAENFEIGTKMVLADGRVNLNAAAFSMQFDNLQTSSYDGTQFIIGNAASAEVTGLEIESQWLATDALTLTASGAFLDATYDEYLSAQCPVGPDGNLEDPTCIDGEGDLSGRQLERTPEVELNLGAAWQSGLTETLDLTASLDYYYSSELFLRQDYDPNGRQDAFSKWNARLAIGPRQGGWQVALIGRNLTDERTIQHAYEVLSDFVSLSEGRTVFLEASYDW